MQKDVLESLPMDDNYRMKKYVKDQLKTYGNFLNFLKSEIIFNLF